MDLSFLKDKTVYTIVTSYPISPRLFCYFASQCAKEEMTKVPNPNLDSLKAVDMAERWGLGEEISMEERVRVTDKAYDAYRTTTIAFNPTAYTAAYTAATYAYAAAATSTPTYSIFYFEKYKPLLLSMLEKNLSEAEKLLIFG